MSTLMRMTLMASIAFAVACSGPATTPSPSAKAAEPEEAAQSSLLTVVGFERTDDDMVVKVMLRGESAQTLGKLQLYSEDNHGNIYRGVHNKLGYVPSDFTYIVPVRVEMPSAAPLIGLRVVDEPAGSLVLAECLDPQMSYQKRQCEDVQVVTVPIKGGRPETVDAGSARQWNGNLPYVLNTGEWVKAGDFLEVRRVSKVTKYPAGQGPNTLLGSLGSYPGPPATHYTELEIRNLDYNAVEVSVPRSSEDKSTIIQDREGGAYMVHSWNALDPKGQARRQRVRIDGQSTVSMPLYLSATLIRDFRFGRDNKSPISEPQFALLDLRVTAVQIPGAVLSTEVSHYLVIPLY